MSAPVFVTGAAGFIGMHLCRRLLADERTVVGVDNLNDYYDPQLKRARLAVLAGHDGFTFHEADVSDRAAIDALFDRYRPRQVVHLAAQAGVRYALENPMAYSDSNLTGMTVVLEACRRLQVEHLVFASSSSVYGANRTVPFSERDPVDHPVSLYAATKRANELMAHSYAHLFALPVTGLRYFTVYGPWGRPDMAIWKFTDALLRDRPIDVYGGGVLSRDFTYIDDTVEATVRLLGAPRAACSAADPAQWNAAGPDTSWAPFEVVNLGRSDPVSVNELIGRLESITGRRARRNEMGMQPGDVERTFSDTEKLKRMTAFTPGIDLDAGLRAFVEWFREYHRIG
jgi:UDP-glucuronate 4-epimerase